jgi:bifunctional DNA-binding transcriptional regulator/antitoxin component of YhaV-PrlF toxin-antitoxin module
VLIPQSIRDAANLKPDERVVVDFDPALRAIVIGPAHEKKLLRLGIALSDKPGSLASAAAVLAKLGVDLVSTQSHSSRRGEAAVWEVECNPGKRTASEIKSALAKGGAGLVSAKWE